MERDVILSAPQLAVLESPHPRNLFLAGQGAGKTFTLGFTSIELINSFPKARGLICANTYDQLNRSTLFRTREVWKDLGGWEEYHPKSKPGGVYVVGIKPPPHFNTTGHNFERYNNIISFEWGTVIFVGSLDNYKALDGLEVAYMLLDETKDTKEEAITEVLNGRLRQSALFLDKKTGELLPEKNENTKPFLPLYIFTSPAKTPWLTEMFKINDFEDEIVREIYTPGGFFSKKTAPGRYVVIASAYSNESNLPDGYIENQRNIIPSYLHGFLIYGNPFTKSGGEYWRSFERSTHVEKCYDVYDPGAPLDVSFDFNRLPYITLLISQTFENETFYIDEIAAAPPHNNVPDAVDLFIKRYAGHVGPVAVYGDVNGTKENIQTAESDYSLILKKLKEVFRVVQNKVLKSNPSVSMRGQFINATFEGKTGVEIYIDPRCKHFITDLEMCKEDESGGIKKARITNKETKQTYEQYGHFSDAFAYHFIAKWKAAYMGYLKGPYTLPSAPTSKSRFDTDF